MVPVVFLIAVTVLVVAAAGVASLRHGRKNPVRPDATPVPGDDIAGVVRTCYDAVIENIDAIVSADPVASCRIYRKTGATVKNVRNGIGYGNPASSDGLSSVRTDYMLESLLRMSETGKAISTNPDEGISILMKCELETLRDSFAAMRNGLEDTRNMYSGRNETWRNESANCMDFMEYLIDIYGRSMKEGDYDDESVRYGYLMLLHYLHSFHKSAVKLLLSQSSNQQKYDQSI